jgi:hypothetical protein
MLLINHSSSLGESISGESGRFSTSLLWLSLSSLNNLSQSGSRLTGGDPIHGTACLSATTAGDITAGGDTTGDTSGGDTAGGDTAGGDTAGEGTKVTSTSPSSACSVGKVTNSGTDDASDDDLVSWADIAEDSLPDSVVGIDA